MEIKEKIFLSVDIEPEYAIVQGSYTSDVLQTR